MEMESCAMPPRENWPDCAVRVKTCESCAFKVGSIERSNGYGFLGRIEKWFLDKVPHFCHENVPGHDEEKKDNSPRWFKCCSQARFAHKFQGREEEAVSKLVNSNIIELRNNHHITTLIREGNMGKVRNPAYKERKERRKCAKKKSYTTVEEAAIKKAFYWLNNKSLLKIYECAWCGHYHLSTDGEMT
jgi:hypothetical protein